MSEQMQTIKCPNCSYEYLPGEIFLPNYFLGQPKEIERDIMGKILWSDGNPQDLKETFICEKCGRKFIVNASINYKVNLDTFNDMDLDYISKKIDDKLYLKED